MATWTITNLQTTTEISGLTTPSNDRIVTGIEYKVTEGVGSYSGKVSFIISELSESYISYADLDESTVIGWVKNKLGAEEVEKIENNVSEIDNTNGIPWRK